MTINKQMSYGFNNLITMPEDAGQIRTILDYNVNKYLIRELPNIDDRNRLIDFSNDWITRVILLINSNLPNKGQFQFRIGWAKTNATEFDYLDNVGINITINNVKFWIDLLHYDGYPRTCERCDAIVYPDHKCNPLHKILNYMGMQ